VDVNRDVLEVLQILVDRLALDGKQADLGIEREAVGDDAGAELLIVPDNLVEVKRDLLLGLEANDVADLLFLDRRQVTKRARPD